MVNKDFHKHNVSVPMTGFARDIIIDGLGNSSDNSAPQVLVK